MAAIALAIIGWPATLLAMPAARHIALSEIFRYFFQTGALLFGSGYVLLPVLERDLVQGRGWLTTKQLVDAIAVGQATPGPVFTTATFIGYVIGGIPAAIVATLGMFLPAFVCSALSARHVERLRRSPTATRFLGGVNAAAVALIGVVLVTLGRDVLVGPLQVAVCLAAALAIFRLHISPTLVLATAAMAGLVLGMWL
jgi:chromate transporter